MQWQFGPFRLDVDNARLWKGDTPIDLRPKSFDVLAYLVRRAGELVSTDELLDDVWSETAVGDAVVKVSIGELRKVLGESGRSPTYIATVLRRGYRFIAEVTEGDEIAPMETLLPPAPEDLSDSGAPPHLDVSPAPSEAERRRLTILFCDLVGSTALSEQLDPEDLNDVLKAYYDVCSQAVQTFEGYVAQYLGDGLLIYFGYPHAHEDAVRRAVHAGLEVVRAMADLNRRLDAQYGVRIEVRIGVDTGVVVVRERREEGRAPPLAVGAAPDIAARIQEQAMPDQVWISDSTYPLVQGYFIVEDMGLYPLRGLINPLRLYRVISVSESQHRLDVQVSDQLTSFVGREMECLVFQDHWEQAKQGQGRVMVLSGEAGIGKSRLARVMLATLSDEPHLLLEGHCSPYHQQTALYPIVNLLQRRLQSDADHPASAFDKVNQLDPWMRHCGLDPTQSVPLLAALLDLPLPPQQYPPLELSPQLQRQRTLETLLNWVVALSEDQPVIVFIEDTHWLDPSTLEWLNLLVDQGPTTSILTVITCRPEFDSPWRGRGHVTELTLNQLSGSQIMQMIQSMAGVETVTADIMDQIVTTAGGVPLFVEEMTRLLLVSNSTDGVGPETASANAMSGVQVPATLSDLLLARLDSVGEAKRTAQLGATIGREFSYALLQAIAQVEEAQLQADLDALMAADLLYRRGMGDRGDLSVQTCFDPGGVLCVHSAANAAAPPSPHCPNPGGTVCRTDRIGTRTPSVSSYRSSKY